jgi:2-methylisocitrate lyase-like PEP mutase family enzyme
VAQSKPPLGKGFRGFDRERQGLGLHRLGTAPYREVGLTNTQFYTYITTFTIKIQTLTGRTENFLRGRPDLDDTIKRLKAYEAAGADALMAPGLPDLEAVRAVCAATEKPFNFMVGIKGKSFTVTALAAAGVKRISLATSLYRAAMTGLLNAAKEVREQGTFGYIDTSLATPEMNAFLRE